MTAPQCGRARRQLPLALAGLLLPLVGCGGEPLPAVDFDVQLRASAAAGVGADAGFAFGAPFALEVVATWRRDLQPAPFEDDWLAPLEVELLRVDDRADDSRRQQVRRYRARAFTAGRVQVPVPPWRAAAAGGGAVEAGGEALVLSVRSALPAGDGGAFEGPLELLPLPAAGGGGLVRWVAALAALGVGVAIAVGRLRRRAAATPAKVAPPPAPPAPPPHALVRQRLDELERAAPPAAAFADRLSALVREVAVASLPGALLAHTTEELVAAAADVDVGSALRGCLPACDLVKFAAATLDDAQRPALLRAARAFVAATWPPPPPTGAPA